MKRGPVTTEGSRIPAKLGQPQHGLRTHVMGNLPFPGSVDVR
jgi:hypothetical protein